MPKRRDLDFDKMYRMWNEGRSAGAIGLYFHVTKNVIIGYITRARFKGVHLRQGKTAPPKPRPEKKVEPKKPEVPKYVKPENVPSLPVIVEAKPILEPIKAGKRMRNVPIYELHSDQCKYSTGTNEFNEFVFCGKDAVGPYCPEHKALCSVKSEPKKVVPYVNHKNKFLHVR